MWGRITRNLIVINIAVLLIVGSLLLRPKSTVDSMVMPTLQAVPIATSAPEVFVLTSLAENSITSSLAQVPLEHNVNLPNIPEAAIPTSQLEQSVSEQLILHFSPGSSVTERQAYIQLLQARIVQTIDALNVVVLHIPAEVLATPLPTSDIVLTSELNYYVSSLQDNAVLSDPYYSEQWALPVIGAASAWEALDSSSSSLQIAVIDSGVAANHPDLVGRLANGWDFVEGDAVPNDMIGHGTAVAGIIAAQTNNAIGITGIAPNVMIIPLRVLDAQGLGTYSAVAEAIVYAADNHANIVNLSLGGTNPSSLLQEAIDYALAKGVLVVAAAGNTGSSQILYPAAYPSVVAVGSIDENLQASAFSSVGNGIDLYAPGSRIISTSIDGTYAYFNGTSFAAPQVSAIAALELATGGSLVQDGGIVHFHGTNYTPTPPIVQTPELPSTPNFISEEVLSELASQGEAQVIINLNVPLTSLSYDDVHVQAVAQAQNAILAKLSVQDFSVYHQFTNVAALAGTLRPSGLSILASQTAILSVYLDDPVYTHSISPVDAIQAGLIYNSTEFRSTGHGVTVAILDTGIDTDHPDFQGRRIRQYCTTTVIDCPAPNVAEDDSGHGTNVAGIIAGKHGLAYDANIVAIRVIGRNAGRTSDWIAGLDVIATYEPEVDVINLSLGTQDIVDGACDAQFGQVFPAGLELINDLVEQRGITIVASSGNQGNWDTLPNGQPIRRIGVNAPACLSNVISVGATYSSATLASDLPTSYRNYGFDWPRCTDTAITSLDVTCFTNIGSGLDIVAPGFQIEGAYFNGQFASYTGTSQAAPIVSGLIALMEGYNPAIDSSMALGLLRDNASMSNPINGMQFPVLDSLNTMQALSQSFCNGVTEIPASECEALVSLYKNTNGIAWTANKVGWLQTITPCTWNGVSCQFGHVTGLNLANSGLNGFIPLTLNALQSLTVLDLHGNALQGLPPSLGNLKKLTILDLHDNPLNAPLPPELGQLNQLTSLNLSNTSLVGTIPFQLGRLCQLRDLNLSSAHLDGRIPTELRRLTNLQSLLLSNNALIGEIPNFGTLPSNPCGTTIALRVLLLNNNQLSGYIPASLGNLSNLEVLRLGYQSLSGGIPAQFAGLQKLIMLELSSNQLTGTIPQGLLSLPALESLLLDHNRLEGAIPQQWQLGKLEVLWLNHNSFIGSLPSSFANLPQLRILHVDSNALSGVLPDSLMALTRLGLPISHPNGIQTLLPASQAETINLDYNMFTASSALTGFLQNYDPNWQNTQTIAPQISVSGSTVNTLTVSITPIAFKDGAGYYEIQAISVNGTRSATLQTVDKYSNQIVINSLAPNTEYRLIARTVSLASTVLPQTLTSEFSAAVPSGTASTSFCDSVSEIPRDECLALEALYYSTDGDNWTDNSGWYESFTIPSSNNIATTNAETLSTSDVSPQGIGDITVTTTNPIISSDGQCSLVEAIENANADRAVHRDCSAGIGDDTIVLQYGSTYTLTAVNNNSDGANGLPPITSVITINGNNAIIERQTSAENFRIFYVTVIGNLTVNDVTVRNGFADNSAINGRFGGGIYNRGLLTLTNSKVSQNTATWTGGGIYSNATVILTNSTVSNNTTIGDNGAGIANYGGTVILNNSTLINNSANFFGGGIYSEGTVTVTNSTVSNNHSNQNGGGITNNGVMTIMNSTVSSNSANNIGGGIVSFGPLEISSTTIFNNTSTVDGQSIAIFSDSVTITNSIIAGFGTHAQCVLGGTFTALGTNFDTDGTCGDATTVTLSALKFSSLGYYGGSTQTYTLLSDSVAIDASTCSEVTDQRGVARTGACDVGAYELDTSAIQTGPDYDANSIFPGDDGLCTVSQCTIIEAINAANADSLPSSIKLNDAATYTLLEINNDTNGLPIINTPIVINGNNATIERLSTAPSFTIFSVSDTGNLTLNDMAVRNGKVDCCLDFFGGGILNRGTASLNNITLTNNIAPIGAAICNFGFMTIHKATISNNTTANAGGVGGGIMNEGTLTISDSIIMNNSAGSTAGGIYNETSLTISNSIISSNSANAGAGIFNNNTMSIISSTISDNSASTNGGGIYNDNDMTITSSTISDNSASTNGGGIYSLGNLQLINSTVANNNAISAGGGLNIQGAGQTTLIEFSTIANNSATTGGNIRGTSAVSFTNSIVANSLNGGDCDISGIGVSGTNFDTDGTCQSFSQHVSSGQLDLQALGDYGGLIPSIRLGVESIARNAIVEADCTLLDGTPLTLDARSFPRPAGRGCDAGAVESEPSPCEWYGVTCFNGHIDSIQLISNNLVGTLPPAIGNLSEMTGLSIGDNPGLIGAIPIELGNLTNMRELSLAGLGLSGAIPPELASLSQLHTLKLPFNQLSGEIPSELGSLSNLLHLELSNNQLSGEIPPELGDLASLRFLYLENNQLTGSIPPELGGLGDLSYINFSNNMLSGSIPSELGNLPSLSHLDVSNNQLTGALPDIWQRFVPANEFTLYLNIRSNQFTGDLPASFGAMLRNTAAETFTFIQLDISYNSFTISATDGNRTRLENQLGWQLASQTVAPQNIEVSTAPIAGLAQQESGISWVSWDAVLFKTAGGYYLVTATPVCTVGTVCPQTVQVRSADLAQTSIAVEGLSSNYQYNVTVQTVNPARPTKPPTSSVITLNPIADFTTSNTGSIDFPQIGSTNVVPFSIPMIAYGTTTASQNIWPIIFSTNDNKYYPQFSADENCNLIPLSLPNWTSPIYFGEGDIQAQYGLMLVETTDLVSASFTNWAVDGCRRDHAGQEPTFPGFSTLPAGIVTLDSIVVQTISYQPNTVTSAPSTAIPVTVPEIIIPLDSDPDEIDSTIPEEAPETEVECAARVSGDFASSFRRGDFASSFRRGDLASSFRRGTVEAQFTVESDGIAPVLVIYEAVYDDNGNFVSKGRLILCRESAVVDPNNPVSETVTLDDEHDYIIYVYANEDTTGNFTLYFDLLVDPIVRIDDIPFGVETSLEPTLSSLPDICAGQITSPLGDFASSFRRGDLASSFRRGDIDVELKVETTAFAPILIIYEDLTPEGLETDTANWTPIACFVAPEIGNLTIPFTLLEGHNYAFALRGNNNKFGRFIFRLDEVLPENVFEITALPFSTNSSIPLIAADLQIPACNGTIENPQGDFQARFRSSNFGSAFHSSLSNAAPNAKLQITVSSDTIAPVLIVYAYNADGTMNPIACESSQAIGTNTFTVSLTSGSDYAFAVFGNQGTSGEFNFEAIDRSQPVYISTVPFADYTSLNVTESNVPPSCGTDASGNFMARFVTSDYSAFFSQGHAGIEFSVTTDAFLPVIAVYEDNNGVLTEVACQSWDTPQPATRQLSVILDANKQYLVAVYANNTGSGNFGFAANWYDLQAPISVLQINPPEPNGQNRWYISDIQINVTAEDNFGGSGVSLIEWSSELGQIWRPIPVPLSISSEGETTVLIRAQDFAGNVETPAVQYLARLDKTAPTADISTNSNSYSRLDDVTISITAADSTPGSGISSITAIFNGQAVTNGTVIDLINYLPGIYTYSLVVTDYAGWITRDTGQIEVVASPESLSGLVNYYYNQGLIDNVGIHNSLQNKLSGMMNALQQGQTQTAINKLNAFIHELMAQSGKHISTDAANSLITDASSLIRSLGGEVRPAEETMSPLIAITPLVPVELVPLVEPTLEPTSEASGQLSPISTPIPIASEIPVQATSEFPTLEELTPTPE